MLKLIASNDLPDAPAPVPDPVEIALAVAAATSAAVALGTLMTPAAAELQKLTAAMTRLGELNATEELKALAPIVLAVRNMLLSFGR